ncbi:MAG TPA: RNA polymerase sigma factor [Patescibacteria group bacterium]|nr:RNA polymerase sigma factor [Patescibacteria group bacterium]
MTNLFDQYLLFRIRTRKDKQAFAKIYDRYVNAIYRFVVLKLPSRELAEDVTAETFLRCWQSIQQNKEISNLRAFLYKIARNLVVDQYRRSEPTVHLSVTFSEDGASSLVETDVSDHDQSRGLIEARADIQLILDRIARLKEDYRDVLTLRLVDGLGFSDIGKILEKSTGNVRVIYHRAMKALDQLESA